MLVRVVLLAFAAAATPAFAQPKTTLNFGMAAQDIGQLDPHFAVSTIDRVPAALMFPPALTRSRSLPLVSCQ